MKKPEWIPVEVDMVPLIDIVSLLLMFLVMVGETVKTANSIPMRLPRADMAVQDGPQEGRLVVQLDRDAAGRYWGVIQNQRYELLPRAQNASLQRALETVAQHQRAWGAAVGKDGELLTPVKLRVPAAAPMTEVERLVTALAAARFVNIHYAAASEKDRRR